MYPIVAVAKQFAAVLSPPELMGDHCINFGHNAQSQSQRRVTFHLPDGSQESCSDSGLGDHEPVGSGTLISHPLPLVQPQDEFYDQASPDKRTEADGNSDPNSGSLSLIDLTRMGTFPCLVSMPFNSTFYQKSNGFYYSLETFHGK
ncbi:hypothetical protein Q9966_016100 [Columba livia]|nr:hypothetical protein Q9966_016100 [Columba livia]